MTNPPQSNMPKQDNLEVDLCKGCNTIKHLGTNGLCGRCRAKQDGELRAEIRAKIVHNSGLLTKSLVKNDYIVALNEFGLSNAVDWIVDYIESLYIKRDKVVEAIGTDEPLPKKPEYPNIHDDLAYVDKEFEIKYRNQLRQQIRQKLGLEGEK